MKKFIIDNWFKLAIIFLMAGGLGIYAYQIFFYAPKAKLHKKIALDECLSSASRTYFSDWTSECLSRKLKADCSLPLKIAEAYKNDQSKSEEQCYQRFKLDVD